MEQKSPDDSDMSCYLIILFDNNRQSHWSFDRKHPFWIRHSFSIRGRTFASACICVFLMFLSKKIMTKQKSLLKLFHFHLKHFSISFIFFQNFQGFHIFFLLYALCSTLYSIYQIFSQLQIQNHLIF